MKEGMSRMIRHVREGVGYEVWWEESHLSKRQISLLDFPIKIISNKQTCIPIHHVISNLLPVSHGRSSNYFL